MTIPELETAFEKRFPVIHDCHNTATPGEYLYSYVSAIIKRHSDHLGKIIIQAEVKNATLNTVALVDPAELRYATPEEFTNYKIKEKKDKKRDALLELETQDRRMLVEEGRIQESVQHYLLQRG